MALKNKKEKNFSEWYTEIVGETGAKLADIRYGVQGFIAQRSLAVNIIRKIENLFEKEVEADGYEPILLPVVVPKKNIEIEKEHVEFAPELFWLTEAGGEKLEEPLYLRPTGESQIYPMYSLWIRSHKDLPFKRYQSRINVYRYEATTRPFLRGREFVFFESHGVFPTHEGVLKQVEKDVEITKKVVHKQLGVPYLLFTRPQWDKFKGAVNTYAPDCLMPDGKVSQIASTHDLGQRFSKAYNVTFTDENEKKQFAWQTCFGPGIWRILAGVIGIHGDNYGLVLPFEVAPVQIVIVPIVFEKTSKTVDQKCKELEKTLKAKSYRVKYDDSENTPGWKFNEWEMKGVPIRIEVGPDEIRKRRLTLVRRDTKKKETITEKELEHKIESYASGLLRNITKQAEGALKSAIKPAKNLEQVKKILEDKGIAKANWCSTEMDGENCADILQTETSGGKVRGTLFDEHEKATGNCIICKKQAKHVVYLAKSY